MDIGFSSIGFVFVIVLIVLTFSCKNKEDTDKTMIKGCVVYCFIFATLFLFSYPIEILLKSLNLQYTYYKASIVFESFGFMMFLLGFYVGIVKRKSCIERRMGKCVGYQTYHGYKGSKSYSPIFTYSLNGEQIKAQSITSYMSLKKLKKKFQINQSYEIFIDPKLPKAVRVDQSIGVTNIIFMTIGMCSIIIGLGIYFI